MKSVGIGSAAATRRRERKSGTPCGHWITSRPERTSIPSEWGSRDSAEAESLPGPGAADERVKVVVPVCQSGSIEHVVVDRATDGHCDCFSWINYYRWCWPDLGAQIAPRLLLIASGSEDALVRPTDTATWPTAFGGSTPN